MPFELFYGNAVDAYDHWQAPTAIISDGPYGIGGYEGDPTNVGALQALYEPHVKKWAELSMPSTVLWFWNTEIGWATTHPIIERHGWKYHGCSVWNKGIGHVAGNCNGKTMRSFPTVTEVCVQYVRDPNFIHIDGMTVQDWLRSEWRRTGLPFSRSNEACGVKNAATRKYLTPDHLFYFPPPEIFEKLSLYANEHGEPTGRPYFVLPENLSRKGRWERIWYNWNFEYGVSNVWDVPAVRGKERIKDGNKAIHLNQKPLALMHRIISAVCSADDIVWEPFGGLASASVAAIERGCRAYAAEINEYYYEIALKRLKQADSPNYFKFKQDLLDVV